MALDVVELTTEAQFVRLHDLLADYFNTDAQCSPRFFYPSLGQIRRAGHVYVAHESGQPLVAALTSDEGRIWWLNGYRPRLLEGAVTIFNRVYTDLGSCWGVVKNAGVRNALLQASGPAGHADGEKIWWRP